MKLHHARGAVGVCLYGNKSFSVASHRAEDRNPLHSHGLAIPCGEWLGLSSPRGFGLTCWPLKQARPNTASSGSIMGSWAQVYGKARVGTGPSAVK